MDTSMIPRQLLRAVSRHLRGAAAGLGLCLALTGCGGGGHGGDDGGPTPPASAIVGAAGGTVTHADGAAVEVPAGALSQDTRITLEVTQTGAPPLPGGSVAAGPMFAFTPHGTAFAAPVTVTLPFDAASVPAGRVPTLLKTNAGQTDWVTVPATVSGTRVSAQVTGFSFLQVVVPPIVRGQPTRIWSFSHLLGDSLEELKVSGATQEGGDLEARFDHGPAFRDGNLVFLDGSTLPPDGIATGQIASTADGITYFVGAEAPKGSGQPGVPIGSQSRLVQVQGFIKRSADATLSITLSGAFVEVSDQNDPARPCPPIHADGLLCDLVKGMIYLDVRAITPPDTNQEVPSRTFFHVGGGAQINGYAGSWDAYVWNDRAARTPLWSVEDFDFLTDALNDVPESLALMTLRQTHTYTIDLSSIAVGQAFFLETVAFATAYSRVHVPPNEFPSSAGAFLRDPQSAGGTTVTFTGLEQIEGSSAPALPAEVPEAPAACTPGPAPDPAAGVLQFSAATYARRESDITPTVTVTRVGGSKGAVTATFSTRDGTARAGTDYTPVNVTVFFGDGDSAPRAIGVPMVQDTTPGEPDKTVNLALTQPGGCAALGAQASAVLTLRDDDPPPPAATFTLGGTVSGLVGSGLVLTDLGEDLPIAANGSFTFTQPLANGLPYTVSVKTHATQPSQVCSVDHASGTVDGANISDVTVACTTPPPTGSLDTSFGSAGKAFSTLMPISGASSAMARQADGKLIVVGSRFGSGGRKDFAATRFNADGSIDTAFGTGGVASADFATGSDDEARGVALQADGRIVVVGHATPGVSASGRDFALARFNTDGTLDASFGAAGRVRTDFNAELDEANAIAIQPDGKIVVAGHSRNSPIANSTFALARYNIDGSLDGGFGNGGKATVDITGGKSFGLSLLLQSDGRVVVAGNATLANSSVLDQIGVARFNGNGALDPAFSQDGKLAFAMSGGDQVALQADGKLLVTGNARPTPFAPRNFALLRLNADGSIDTAFGNAGVASIDLGATDDIASAVAVQADGRILVAGRRLDEARPAATDFDFGLARLAADGSLDASFATGGTLVVDFFAGADIASVLLVQPDGRILLGGSARNGNASGIGLLRVQP